MSETRPVLIVGAGPTGMTAAMELSRFGVPVRLVDRYQQPPNTSRALAVQSRTMELFSQRGLSDEMLKLGNKGFFTTIYGGGKTLGKVDLRSIQSRFNYVLLLAQSETERILREKLQRQGVEVERETELIAFSQGEKRDGGTGVRAILRKPCGALDEVDAAYLIDCEGSHSTIRHTLGLPFRGKSLQHSYALADLHLDGEVPEDQLSIFVAESGLLAAFPMGGKRYRVIATEKQSATQNEPDPDIAHMQQLWNQGSHIAATFKDMIWSSRFRINSRMLDHLRQQSVFFGGDSAHVHSPAGGQGMNTGIQDMINLGWKMAFVYRGLAKPELLDTYESERMPIIKALVSTTEKATDLFDSDSRLTLALLEHAMPVALSLKAVQTKGAGIVSETEGNYRSSLLAFKQGHTGAVHAGDRLPDEQIGADGQGRTLTSLLDPSRFTLLIIDGSEVPEELAPWATEWNVQSLSPVQSHGVIPTLRQKFGDAKFVLVRPDAYVSGLVIRDDVAKFTDWCQTWFRSLE